MSIILVYPPQRIYEGHGQGREWPPIGIASIAANLGKECICLDLFDYSEEDALEEIIKYLDEDNNFVGFTMLTEQRHVVLDLCEKLKNQFICRVPVTTIVGGPHPSIMYQQLTQYKFLDYIVVGEGENAFREIVSGKGTRVFKYSLEKDLDNFNPAIEGLKHFKTSLNFKEAPIILSRGCTDHCFFCSTNKTWGIYRSRSSICVANEIAKYKELYGIEYFKFQDDSATADKQKIIDLCNLIRNFKIKFELTCRADQFDEEMIQQLKIAGCLKVALGVETGNDKFRQKMGKNLDRELMYENIALLKKYEIHVHLLLILGWPGETDETVEDTCQMIRDLQPDSWSKLPGLMIVPGTPVYNQLKKRNYIDDNYWLENKPCPYYVDDYITPNQLNIWHNKINNCMAIKKILIAAVVNQDEKIFEEYLKKLGQLKHDKNIIIKKFFILHNSSNLKKYLNHDEYICVENNLDHDFRHEWSQSKFAFLAAQKNKIVEKALQSGADYLFWVDSDLIIHEKTLDTLINRNVDIIGNIFWTEWPETTKQGFKEMPNCWDIDQYNFVEGFDKYREKGIYYVGGTGACILVNANVYRNGATYNYIPNISFSIWEDRAFCIRATVLGYPILLDTTYPAKHLYTEKIAKEYFENEYEICDKMEVEKVE